MASTLLQLVNRVRRRLRVGDTAESGFDQDELNLVLVDLLNASGDAVLGQNEWGFEVRHDGHIRTLAKSTFSSVAVYNYPENGSLSKTDDDMAIAMRRDGAVVRVLLEDIAAVADTALTIARFGTSDGILPTTVSHAVLREVPIGVASLGSPSSVVIMSNEYVLPSTVRRIVSVTHQSGNMRLEEINRSQVFDRFVQRPHESFSDNPEIVVLGGHRIASEDTGYVPGLTIGDSSGVDEIGMTMLVWPTPESSYTLNYSYVIAYPQLSVVTDTWDGIDPMVESAIVELAYAKAMQTDVGKDVEAGVVLETRALVNVKQLLAMDRQMPGQHLTLRSHFGPRGHHLSPGRMPRHFGSL